MNYALAFTAQIILASYFGFFDLFSQSFVNRYFFELEQDLPSAELIDNQNVLISWVTINNNEVDLFMIERSKDGLNYEAIGQTPVHADSRRTLHLFLDSSPLTGLYTYRISALDSLQRLITLSEFSFTNGEPLPIVDVSRKETYLSVRFNDLNKEAVLIRLYDNDDRCMGIYHCASGADEISIPLSEDDQFDDLKSVEITNGKWISEKTI